MTPATSTSPRPIRSSAFTGHDPIRRRASARGLTRARLSAWSPVPTLIKLWGRPAHPPPRQGDIAVKIAARCPGRCWTCSSGQHLGSGDGLSALRRRRLCARPVAWRSHPRHGPRRRGGRHPLARRLARENRRSHPQPQAVRHGKIILAGREAEFGVPFLDFRTAAWSSMPIRPPCPKSRTARSKPTCTAATLPSNTLAIRLDSGHYGELLDFYGGQQDLKNRLIRALHSLSFIEDPTRILRRCPL